MKTIYDLNGVKVLPTFIEGLRSLKRKWGPDFIDFRGSVYFTTQARAAIARLSGERARLAGMVTSIDRQIEDLKQEISRG